MLNSPCNSTPHIRSGQLWLGKAVDHALGGHGCPSNVTELAAILCLSPRSLQRKCSASGVSAKRVVDFLTCLEALHRNLDCWSVSDLFPERDPRTASRLLRVGGLANGHRPTLTEFICLQCFLTSHSIRLSLSHHIEERLKLIPVDTVRRLRVAVTQEH